MSSFQILDLPATIPFWGWGGHKTIVFYLIYLIILILIELSFSLLFIFLKQYCAIARWTTPDRLKVRGGEGLCMHL